MTETTSIHDVRTPESLIRDLEQNRGVCCADCAKPLCSHELLVAIALGYKDAPRCVPCLSEALLCDPVNIRDSVIAYIRKRQCYADAWNWANREAGLPEDVMPPALLSLTSTRAGR